jgi:cytochrome o ubiquinol oxidase operon protein cyoD
MSTHAPHDTHGGVPDSHLLPDGHRLGHGSPGHDHADDAASHGTMKDYVMGFVLSVILTALAFWLVMDKVIESSGMTALAILALGAVQIVVHMVYFLHMNMRSEGGWTMLALMFTAVMVVITLSGSLWVMHHLKSNTMQMTPEEARNMP